MAGKHNPVLNGSTKRFIMVALIFTFVLTLLAMLGIFGVFMIGSGFVAMVIAKSVFGSLAATGLGAMTYAIKKFMDTRDDVVKDNYKLEKQRIKNERLKIKKGVK